MSIAPLLEQPLENPMTQPLLAQCQVRKPGIQRLITLIAPVLAAAALGVNSLQATPLQGQTAINAKLDAFIIDYSTDPNPDVTKGKVPTNVTAKPADLLLAIAAVLEDPGNTLSAADVIAGALLPDVSTKTRGDRDKVIASMIDQAIKSTNIAGNGAQIAALVQAVLDTNFTNQKLGLTNAGRAAAIGQALKSSTDPLTGDLIADQQRVKDSFTAFTKPKDAQKFAATILLNASTGSGANAGAVGSFIDSLFDSNTLSNADRLNNGIAIAKLVKKSNAAVGATILGALYDAPNAATAQAGAIAALNKTHGLQAAANDITSAAAGVIRANGGTTTDVVNLANALRDDAGVAADVKTRGGIAGGAIAVANAGDATVIYNNLAPTDKAANVITFASLAAVNNDDTRVTTITTLAKGFAGIDKAKLGAAIITAISLTNPQSADAVGAVLGADGSLANKDALAASLAKGAKSSAAAGGAAAGVASILPETGANSKTSVAIAANKAASKFISNITMSIGQQLVEIGQATKLTTFAAALTGANTGKAPDIATGASLANPIYSDQIVDKVVFLPGGKIKGSAAKVVQAVSMATDVEEIAEIVTQVSTHFTGDGKAAGAITADNALKVSTAAAIATAAAKAIQSKSGVKTANRRDELGETAASIVGQLIDGFKNNNLVLKKGSADLAKLISSVTSNIIKTLSKKERVDNYSLDANAQPVGTPLAVGATVAADLTASVNIAGDVANTLKQALTLNLIDLATFNVIKTQLLKDIPKLGGKSYGDYKLAGVLTPGLITKALNLGFAGDNVRFEDGTQVNTTGDAGYPTNPSTLNPTTKTGSIIDPETDSRPG